MSPVQSRHATMWRQLTLGRTTRGGIQCFGRVLKATFRFLLPLMCRFESRPTLCSGRAASDTDRCLDCSDGEALATLTRLS